MDLFVSAVRDTVKRFSLLKPGDSVLVRGFGRARLGGAAPGAQGIEPRMATVAVGPPRESRPSRRRVRCGRQLRRNALPAVGGPAPRPVAAAEGGAGDESSGSGPKCPLPVPLRDRVGRRVRRGHRHNLQDQAETFLLKLARGAGPTGLSGIFPAREILPPGPEEVPVRMVRPLLERDREEILGFLERRGQPYRDDSSNRNLRYDRNWVRHHLIPDLRSRLNPALVPTLGRAARLFQEVAEFLKDEGNKAFQSCRETQSIRPRRGPAEGRGASGSGAGPQERGGPARGESLQGGHAGFGPWSTSTGFWAWFPAKAGSGSTCRGKLRPVLNSTA